MRKEWSGPVLTHAYYLFFLYSVCIKNVMCCKQKRLIQINCCDTMDGVIYNSIIPLTICPAVNNIAISTNQCSTKLKENWKEKSDLCWHPAKCGWKNWTSTKRICNRARQERKKKKKIHPCTVGANLHRHQRTPCAYLRYAAKFDMVVFELLEWEKPSLAINLLPL